MAGHVDETRQPTLSGWLWRPLSFIGPSAFTRPVIDLFGRTWTRRSRSTPAPA